MLHTHRDIFEDWQCWQRQFWVNPWLADMKSDDSIFSFANPWAKSWIEQSIGWQSAWFKKWQETMGLTARLPSLYADSLRAGSESWTRAQRQVFNAWIGMYLANTARAAADSTSKTTAGRRVTRSATPRAAAPEQLKLDTRDDLKQISGIGPGLEKKLNDQGITSFRQIAGLTKADIARLEETVIKFPGRVERDNWIGQAKKLAQA